MFMNPNLIHGYCSYFTTSLPSYIDFYFAKPLFWNIICTGAAQFLAGICRIAANGTAYTKVNYGEVTYAEQIKNIRIKRG